MNKINEMILYSDLQKKLESKVIGRSITFPSGWIKIEDLEKILEEYKRMEWK